MKFKKRKKKAHYLHVPGIYYRSLSRNSKVETCWYTLECIFFLLPGIAVVSHNIHSSFFYKHATFWLSLSVHKFEPFTGWNMLNSVTFVTSSGIDLSPSPKTFWSSGERADPSGNRIRAYTGSEGEIWVYKRGPRREGTLVLLSKPGDAFASLEKYCLKSSTN